jgi:S-adenosylmethionine-diacylgycerolhomoserine-N-methlytransferase
MNASAETQGGHAAAMDRMYRLQRHVYDATRRYYLLGRDQLLDELSPPSGGSILEIGCGTGRNLLGAAHRYPEAKLCGVDISLEMLKTAAETLDNGGLVNRAKLVWADATDLSSLASLEASGFDRIYFSFTLSMIPDWQRALAQAMMLLKPGGELHVVDFGQCEQFPAAAKHALFTWLAAFHVTPRWDLALALHSITKNRDAALCFRSLYRGYSWLASIRLLESGERAAHAKSLPPSRLLASGVLT